MDTAKQEAKSLGKKTFSGNGECLELFGAYAGKPEDQTKHQEGLSRCVIWYDGLLNGKMVSATNSQLNKMYKECADDPVKSKEWIGKLNGALELLAMSWKCSDERRRAHTTTIDFSTWVKEVRKGKEWLIWTDMAVNYILLENGVWIKDWRKFQEEFDGFVDKSIRAKCDAWDELEISPEDDSLVKNLSSQRLSGILTLVRSWVNNNLDPLVSAGVLLDLAENRCFSQLTKEFIRWWQGDKCAYCMKSSIDEFHHIIQFSEGGDTDHNNCGGYCKTCHKLLTNDSADEGKWTLGLKNFKLSDYFPEAAEERKKAFDEYCKTPKKKRGKVLNTTKSKKKAAA